MPKSSRKKKKKRRPGAGSPPPAAGQRAPDAVDWVAGIGWKDERNRRTVIEFVLAVHHDQARCMYRAHEAAGYVPEAEYVEYPGGVLLICMPVPGDAAETARRMLEAWRREGDRAWKRHASRIGLGAERTTEGPHIPPEYIRTTNTARNGRPLQPIEPRAFADFEDGRLVGPLYDEGPNADVSELDQEPTYCAGIGADAEPDGVPYIVQVLALGRTCAEAAGRGAAVFDRHRMQACRPAVVLKVARIAPINGLTLRETMQEALEHNGKHAATSLLIGLGRADRLVPTGAGTQQRAAATPLAQMTVNGQGQPQLWKAGTEPDPYWNQRVQ